MAIATVLKLGPFPGRTSVQVPVFLKPVAATQICHTSDKFFLDLITIDDHMNYLHNLFIIKLTKLHSPFYKVGDVSLHSWISKQPFLTKHNQEVFGFTLLPLLTPVIV